MATEHGKRIAREYLQALVDVITALDAPACCAEDGTEWFALAAAFQALDVPCNFDNPTADLDDPDSVLGRVVRCVRLEAIEAAGETWPMISFRDLLAHVVPFGRAPVAQTYNDWLCSTFLPAIGRTGWYDPPTAHQPPVGQELTALEHREQFRDSLDAVLPGLSTWVMDEEE